MKKKIFLFSRDPGGANTIIPLVEPLKEKGYEIRLFGKDIALAKYVKANLTAFNIMDFIQNGELSSIEKFLADEKPDLIITGTSADDHTEKFIWKLAEKLNIPSFAIIDQWINYGVRFSGYGVSQLKEYLSDKTHPYLPSKILVIDEMSRQEAIMEGLDPSVIEVVGHPHFETLLNKKKKITIKETAGTRRHFEVNNGDFMITFASEPISSDYDRESSLQQYWGFSEKTIFNELLDAIKKANIALGRKVAVIIKLHPRENIHNYSEMVNTYNGSHIKIKVSENFDSCDLMCASDLICGMSSMFLIESIILSKPVMSIQIGLKRENPFVLDRLGSLKSILDRDELSEKMRLAMSGTSLPKCNFEFIRNPIENIINLMEMYLCRN